MSAERNRRRNLPFIPRGNDVADLHDGVDPERTSGSPFLKEVRGG